MKRKIVWLLLVLILVTSCVHKELLDPPLELPIWSASDLSKVDSALNGSSTQSLLSQTRTFYVEPPFYKGSVPFKYDTYSVNMGSNLGSYQIANIFSDYVNLFAYDDAMMMYSGIASKAITFDKEGNQLAEAVIIEGPKDQAIVILEVHYDSVGRVVYWCKSKIDISNLGLKEEEYDTHGKKDRDYYFIWPSMTY